MKTLYSISAVHIHLRTHSTVLHDPTHVLSGLVRDRSGNQKARTDLFDVSVRQPNLVLDVAFDGSVFFTELTQERDDPLRS